MLDTIEVRAHGILDRKTNDLEIVQADNLNLTKYAVDEHHELYKKMLRYKGRSFEMVQTVKQETMTTDLVDEDDFLQYQNNRGNVGMSHIKNVMRFIDADKVKEVNMRINGKYNNPSSISAVTFKINEQGSYIDFNLSIPKYLYSHSLAEFIPQPMSSTYFKTYNVKGYNRQRKLLYNRLMRFIDLFLSDLSKMFELDTIPNKNYIEIRRIDICWNQYFKDRQTALHYLSHQKQIAKKKNTATNNKLDTYETSLNYFTSSGAYFKIYHKGTEYVSSKFGDYKKHMDFNKAYIEECIRRSDVIGNKVKKDLENRDFVLKLFDDKLKDRQINIKESLKDGVNRSAQIIRKLSPFKVEFLKTQMDRVLRYELSLRGDFFAYNYKKKVFRKDCPLFGALKENHKFVHSVYTSVKHRDTKVSKYELNDYKQIEDFYKRKVCLTLSSSRDFKRHLTHSGKDYNMMTTEYKINSYPYPYTLLSTKDVGIFCDDFLQICITAFRRIVDSFQVTKLESFNSIASKIKEYNDQVEKRVVEYNQDNYFRTIDNFGNKKIKGNMVITKATQLLTAKEKREKHLKGLNSLRLLQIVREMERGKSLREIREDLGIHKSNFSRLKADLEMFGVFENTLEMETDYIPDISFAEYYFNTGGHDYQKSFYFKQKHLQYF